MRVTTLKSLTRGGNKPRYCVLEKGDMVAWQQEQFQEVTWELYLKPFFFCCHMTLATVQVLWWLLLLSSWLLLLWCNGVFVAEERRSLPRGAQSHTGLLMTPVMDYFTALLCHTLQRHVPLPASISIHISSLMSFCWLCVFLHNVNAPLSDGGDYLSVYFFLFFFWPPAVF